MAHLLQNSLIDSTPFSGEQTVPRSLVHKRSLENVLLTDLRAHGERFRCAGRVPTAHLFFNDRGRTPRRDILFYTELGRQASLAISHAFLEVSTADVFIFEGSRAGITPAAWSAHASEDLASIEVEVRISELTRRRNNAVNRVVADHVMTIDGEELFRGTGAWTIQPAALFQRLRRASASSGTPLPASGIAADIAPHAGRRRRGGASNVVITMPESTGEGAFAASLVVDDAHPYFFDHPCDHVPGILLLEGCAQLALAAFGATTGVSSSSAVISAYQVSFAQFVENGVPTTLTARVASADGSSGARVEIAITQPGAECGSTTMDVAVAL
jgi:hypothetical protein